VKETQHTVVFEVAMARRERDQRSGSEDFQSEGCRRAQAGMFSREISPPRPRMKDIGGDWKKAYVKLRPAKR